MAKPIPAKPISAIERTVEIERAVDGRAWGIHFTQVLSIVESSAVGLREATGGLREATRGLRETARALRETALGSQEALRLARELMTM